MYPADRYLNRQIQMTLYMLKRQYGGTIDVYKLADSVTDVRTGAKVITKSVTRIDRAIVPPCRVKRDAKQGISLISANKMLVSGGTYDSAERDFIIDRRDCPDLPALNQDDWLVFRNRKYQIKEVEEFEFESGWIITGRELIGETPEQIFNLTAENYLELTDEIETED